MSNACKGTTPRGQWRWGKTLGGSDDQRGMWRALPLPTGPLGAAAVSGLILHPLRPPKLLEPREHEREARGKSRTGLEGALVRGFRGLVEQSWHSPAHLALGCLLRSQA